MSSGPSDENVEQTKRRIRTLVNEVTELSKSDIKAGEYYPAVLQKIIAALAAEGGAISSRRSSMGVCSHDSLRREERS